MRLPCLEVDRLLLGQVEPLEQLRRPRRPRGMSAPATSSVVEVVRRPRTWNGADARAPQRGEVSADAERRRRGRGRATGCTCPRSTRRARPGRSRRLAVGDAREQLELRRRSPARGVSSTSSPARTRAYARLPSTLMALTELGTCSISPVRSRCRRGSPRRSPHPAPADAGVSSSPSAVDQKAWNCIIQGDGTKTEQKGAKVYPKPMFDFNERRQFCLDRIKEAYDVGLYGNDERVLSGEWKKLFKFDDKGGERKEEANGSLPRGTKRSKTDASNGEYPPSEDEDDVGDLADQADETQDQNEKPRKVVKQAKKGAQRTLDTVVTRTRPKR